MSEQWTCPCGRRIQDTANLCPDCGDRLRLALVKIAERWPALETSLAWRESGPNGELPPRTASPDQTQGGSKGWNATGLTINERSSRAKRTATDAVWFLVQVIREDYETIGRPFHLPGSDVATLARWVATWHLSHVTHGMAQETAEEVARDVDHAEWAVYGATHPSGIHWAPVNLRCEQRAATEQGERVPCPGWMWAKVGRDVMPDLVCDHDPEHRVEPQVWERAGWKRRLRQPHPDGLTRLACRLA